MPESIVENIDCMIGMARFPDKFFDLAVVDPPYGILDSGGQTGGKGKLRNRILNNGVIDRWDKKPPSEYFDELFRVSENQIICGGNYFELPPSRCFICWDKVQPWDNFSQVEFIWTSFVSPSKLFKFDNRTGDKVHPTQKPIKLYSWIYKNYLPNGGKVIDTHLGSGSNRIAADKAGNIDFTGYELDKDYFEAQEKRWRNYKAQLKLF